MGRTTNIWNRCNNKNRIAVDSHTFQIWRDSALIGIQRIISGDENRAGITEASKTGLQFQPAALYSICLSQCEGGEYCCNFLFQMPILLKSTLLSYIWLLFNCQFVTCKRNCLEDCIQRQRTERGL
jgi:hypothetical protein